MYEEGLHIKIVSSRKMDGVKLGDLVEFNDKELCEDVESCSLKINWEIEIKITPKKDEEMKDFNITMAVKGKEGLVTLKNNRTTVHYVQVTGK